MNFTQAQTPQQQSQTIQPAPLYGEIIHRVEAAAKIPLWHSVAIFGFIFGLIAALSNAVHWTGWFWWATFFGLLISFGIYLIELWRWNVMRERISKGDFNGDGKPDVGQALVIEVKDAHGNRKTVHGLSKKDKQDLLTMARAYNAHTSASYDTMQKNHGIGRRRVKKINDAFLQLGWIEKIGDNKNDTFELADNDYAREGMKALAYGQFETVEGVWPTRG